jgi:hypothetical protein
MHETGQLEALMCALMIFTTFPYPSFAATTSYYHTELTEYLDT